MLKINIISVGSIKEKFFIDAINEYKKRLSRFCNFNQIEVQEEALEKSVSKKVEKESQKLIKALSGVAILLDRQGKMVSSEDLAETIDKIQNQGNSEISFVIGGSNGVSEELKKRCDFVFSFGKITFPHQLFRVVLSEQIYRAISILNSMPYHK